MNQHRFRENISRKALREFFNQRENTNVTRYTDAEHERRFRQYLDLAEAHRNQRKEEQNQRKRNDKQQQRRDIREIKNPNMKKLKRALNDYTGQSIVVQYLADKPTLKNLRRLDDAMTTHLNEYVAPKEHFRKGRKSVVLIQSVNYNIPTDFSRWWKGNVGPGRDWIYDSEMDIFQYTTDMFDPNLRETVPIEEYDNHFVGSVFIYAQNKPINAKKIVQMFRDGVNHCVFTPIRNWATAKMNEATTEKTKYRYSGMLNKLDGLEEKYAEGVPEEGIHEICNTLQIDMSIDMPLCENKFIEVQSIKKRLRLFRFVNTRLNHVELNEVVNNDEFETVSRKDLMKLKNELDECQEFYTYTKDMKNINSINTLTKKYKLPNQFSETVHQFEIDTGLNFCKIDDVDNPQLSAFIKEATNYNGTIDFQCPYEIDRSHIHHIDMEKAYKNFPSCQFYEGFLGKITDFRITNKVCGVGIYRITNIKIPKGPFADYNAKLRIYYDNNPYTSPELKFLDSMGATYDVVSGCWGVKPLYFEFNHDMANLRDGENQIPYYSKWTGVCDQHKLEREFWMKGDINFFDTISDHCEHGTVRYYSCKEGCISYPKKHNYHLGHITSFITAYQRLSMLEQLMEIEFNNVVRVCVDGIYHTQEKVPLKNVFRVKNELNFNNEAGDSYVSEAYKKHAGWLEEPKFEREHFAKQLHLGPGGCGKTHHNLNDKGLVRVLFLAPSWKLARSKETETGIKSSVWARALSDDPEKISFIKQQANVLIVDEISMLSENQKQQFFRTYNDMKIIMCGDLGYQLGCIEGVEADDSGFDNIVHHNQDWRCQDKRLKFIKHALREMVRKGAPKAVINDWVLDAFKKLERVIDVDTLQKSYKINDMILTGTNEMKDYYTGLFRGKFGDTEKYYVMENNRLYCNGDIVIGSEPDSKCEVRHCFTTHSIQGETANFNLFIDSSKMFDSRMFYTAISRARTLDQIFIIKNELPKFKYEFGKIYKISSTNGVYIGSTIQKLEKRLDEHKKAFENYQKGKGKYMTSFEILPGEKLNMELLENFKCNDLKDLWEREAEIIRAYGEKCVNKTFNEFH